MIIRAVDALASVGRSDFACGQIGILKVLEHHTLCIEKRAVEGNCRAHDLGIGARPAIEHREDNRFQLVVEGADFR